MLIMTEPKAVTVIDGRVDTTTPREIQQAMDIVDDTITAAEDERLTVEKCEVVIDDNVADFSIRLEDDKTYKQEDQKNIARQAMTGVMNHSGDGCSLDFSSNIVGERNRGTEEE